LQELTPGSSTRQGPATQAAEPVTRESVSAYLTIRITDPDRSLEVYNRLSALEGVEHVDAVRGDVDLIVLAQAHSQPGIQDFFNRVRAIPGIEVASLSPVERPRIDRDVTEFIDVYQKAVKAPAQQAPRKQGGTTSYIIVDIDKDAIQQIFTTVFFIDEVVFCDVIEGGTKLVGMVIGQSAVGRTPHIIEKISQIDGVLRVREAKVIRIAED
jgi:nitrate reductase NapAB chaperone NapD